MLTDADRTYIATTYVTLEELCAGRTETPAETATLIEERRLPRPSYVLEDGTGMFPADYFRLVDEAGGIEALEGHFAGRHRQATFARATATKEPARDWEMYLRGTWGICPYGARPGGDRGRASSRKRASGPRGNRSLDREPAPRPTRRRRLPGDKQERSPPLLPAWRPGCRRRDRGAGNRGAPAGAANAPRGDQRRASPRGPHVLRPPRGPARRSRGTSARNRPRREAAERRGSAPPPPPPPRGPPGSTRGT